MIRTICVILFAVFVAAPLAAQDPFTDSAARVPLNVLAADSMGGRLVGTPGARAAALHLAEQLRVLGLAPAGDSGGYLQRIPLERRGISDSSTLQLTSGDHSTTLHWGRTFGVEWGRPAPAATYDAVWGNLYTRAGIDSTFKAAAGKFLVIVIPDRAGLIVQGFPATDRPVGIIALFASPRFRARALRLARPPAVRLAGSVDAVVPPLVLLVDRDSLATVFGSLTQGPAGTPAPFRVTPRLTESVVPVDGWNVLATRQGNDPRDKGEYVMVTSQYDHVGRADDPAGACRAVGADSVCNGAGAASGAVAELLLAEHAVAAPAPRRSMLFAWLGAEEPGSLGLRWLLAHPPVPIDSLVADIGLGPVGRGAADSLQESGIREYAPDLVRVVDSVARAEPSPFTLVGRFEHLDDPQRRYCRTPAAGFAMLRIPSITLSGGPYAEFRRADDGVALIDANKVARTGRLAYGIGMALGNARSRPAADSMLSRSLCR
ncbi:MAG TPA: M28 family peptidase [Gemmatimonadales bacterium]|nr:M28 family peptidase [Gemmatimonadales bacterium]